MESIFVFSIICVFHTYFGYPLSLLVLSIFIRNPINKKIFFPTISIIIAAYNEEKRIRTKINNILSANYPSDKMEIIVVSDGSTDKTNTIVNQYYNDNVKLIILEKRSGKENAQKIAISKSLGDILVFTDVSTIFDNNSIREIVSNFYDSTVGCVSSTDRLVNANGKSSGEGFYVQYEMWMRRIEYSVCSLIGLSGSFFAARRVVCQDFSGDMQSDFRVLLNSIRLGYRGVADSKAIGFYQDVAIESKEFGRKIRTVLRGMTVFFNNTDFLNFKKYGLFSYQLFCHKLLRWMVPCFLITTFFSNFFILDLSLFYFVLLVCQLLFYGTGIWGIYFNKSYANFLIKIPKYFITVNTAILVAWFKYFKGQRIVMWEPSKR